MLGGIGVWILVVVGVLALAAAIAAVLYFRFGVFRHWRSSGRGKSKLLDQSRIEVLESTYVDAERRLVLVRCDRIEHLILVGGPADLVVENDVKKVRGPGAASQKAPIPDAAQGAAGSLMESAGLSAPVQPAVRPPAAADRPRARPEAAAGTGAPSRPSPAIATGAHAGEKRARPGETQTGRREPRPQQPRTIQPAPLGAAPQQRREQPAAGRGNGRRGEGAPGLPAAGVPWTEPDSIEDEIVQALRFDPVAGRGNKAPAPQPAVSPSRSQGEASDSSATLGDLADRLEEALAQEVQSAGHESQIEQQDADEFAFETPGRPNRTSRPAGQDRPEEQAETSRRVEQKSRAPAPREPQPAAEAPRPAPEPERRREPSPEPERRRESSGASDRREEAPVISLNSRRREAADPLEDEMARLLGELTGDTKGR